MLDFWQNCPFSRRITFQLVSHDHPGRFGPAPEQAPEETLGRIRIAPFLDKDIKHDPVLIDSPPERVQLAPDPDKTSSRCHLSPGFGRRRLRVVANCRPKRMPQSRMLS